MTDPRLAPVYRQLRSILTRTSGRGRVWEGILQLIEFCDELAKREQNKRIVREIHEKVYVPWLERQLEALERQMNEKGGNR